MTIRETVLNFLGVPQLPTCDVDRLYAFRPAATTACIFSVVRRATREIAGDERLNTEPVTIAGAVREGL